MPRKKPDTVRSLRAERKILKESIMTLRALKDADDAYLRSKIRDLEAKLAEKEDKLLPQKQLLLKELSFLTNATSRAIRTTMWALKPPSQRGW